MSKVDYYKANREAIMGSWERLAETNKSADELYKNRRSEIGDDLRKLIGDFQTRDMPYVVTNLQAEVFSLRSHLVGEISTMMTNYSKKNNYVKKILGDRREYYATGQGMKYTDKMTTEIINRDLSEHQAHLEILQVHIEFLRESVKQCEAMNFAIKNRIELLRHTMQQSN